MVFQIAIDGPVAAGKGTVARLVAERLGFLYVDTGAMYRATALLASEKGVAIEDEAGILKVLRKVKISLRNPTVAEQDGRLTTVLLGDEDVSWKIRSIQLGQAASAISANARVRKELVKRQQAIASTHSVVMEGRDIATRVLPQAQLKFFMTANEMVRAKRRHLELQFRGLDVRFPDVLAELRKRDFDNSHRQADPLRVIDEHIVIDTSDLGVDKVVDLIVAKAKMMIGKQ